MCVADTRQPGSAIIEVFGRLIGPAVKNPETGLTSSCLVLAARVCVCVSSQRKQGAQNCRPRYIAGF